MLLKVTNEPRIKQFVFHSCRVMASIKDSSDKAQNDFEPQEVRPTELYVKTGAICVRYSLQGFPL